MGEKNLSKDLGNAVAKARKQRKWTRAQLAEKCGLSIQTISSLEHGITQNCKITTLASIAETLNLDANYLLGLTVKPTELENECKLLTPSQQDFIKSTIDRLHLYEEEREK